MLKSKFPLVIGAGVLAAIALVASRASASGGSSTTNPMTAEQGRYAAAKAIGNFTGDQTWVAVLEKGWVVQPVLSSGLAASEIPPADLGRAMSAIAAFGLYAAYKSLRQEVESPTWQAILYTMMEDTMPAGGGAVNIPASVEAWLYAANVDPLHAPSFKGFPSSIDGLLSKVGAPPLSNDLLEQLAEVMDFELTPG